MQAVIHAFRNNLDSLTTAEFLYLVQSFEMQALDSQNGSDREGHHAGDERDSARCNVFSVENTFQFKKVPETAILLRRESESGRICRKGRCWTRATKAYQPSS